MNKKGLILFLISFMIVLLLQSIYCYSNIENLKINSFKTRLKTSSPKEKYNIYTQLSLIYSDNNVDSAEYFANKAIDIAKAQNDKLLLQEAYYSLGEIYTNASIYDKAIENFKKFLESAKENDDRKSVVRGLNSIGQIHYLWSDYQSAIENFDKSLKIAFELNDKTSILNSYLNIGRVYLDWEKYTKALDFFKKSLEIAQKTDNKLEEARILMDIGLTYTKLKNYTLSQMSYFKSIPIAEQLGSKKIIAECYQRIGIVDLTVSKTKKFFDSVLYNNYLDKAVDNFTSSKNINEVIDNRAGLASNHLGLGEVYIKKRDYKIALENLFIADSISTADNLLSIKKEVYKFYSEIYAIKGDYKNAYTYYLGYTTIKDSIFKEQSTKNNSEMLVRIETANKENEIKLLKKNSENEKFLSYFLSFAVIIVLAFLGFVAFRYKEKNQLNQKLAETNSQLAEFNEMLTTSQNELKSLNTDLAETNEKLKESEENLLVLNATKDKFFSIISHDLKNPLHALMLTSDMLLHYYDKFDDAFRVDKILNIKKTSQNLNNLLVQLLDWARSQSGKIEFHPIEIYINDLIKDNIELLTNQAESKKIELINETEHLLGVEVDKNMISTVIRNLTSNAIKFTPFRGQIRFFASDYGDFIKVVIADNGVGISEEDIQKLFRIDVHHTSVGTSKEKGTGLGLIMCKEFISKHGGEIWVESEIGKGSEFIFTLPKKIIIQ